MPGYELDRFVDLSETEKTELTCSICQDIFKNPVVTNCCRQTFCEDCINEWLQTNNTCPYDRQDLNASQLTPSARVLLNMLGKLKICCNYKENGCKEVVQLENLNNHMKSCRFNKRICKECKLEILNDHNCIKCLLEANARLKDKLESLEKENVNYLQTIQDLTNNDSANNNFSISENQMLIDARKHMESVILECKTTSAALTSEIVKIVKDAINKERKLYDVCRTIQNNTESKLGSIWECIALYDDIGNFSNWSYNNYYVSLTFGKLKFFVHKVYDGLNVEKLAQLLRSGELKEELDISSTDMNECNIKIIKEITFDGIKKSKNLTEICSSIADESEKKFGGIWNCIVFKRNLGNYSIHKKSERYINCFISDFDFIVFQSPD